MAGKFYGAIGYAHTVETNPGVWQEVITEKTYSGDVLRNTMRWREGGEKLNADFQIDNRFSIVADPFAYENFNAMRYICWMGTKWKITSAEVNRPRITLTIGGVYNEQQSEGSSSDSGGFAGEP